MKLNFFTVLVVLFFNTVFSQNEEVLFTVNNTAVTTNEFSRVYNKNIDLVQDEKQKDVDEYLKLYVNYKLKLEEAYALGLDKDKKYKNEFESYRRQLARKYLTDTKINDKLLEEAYERTVNEVNVNHILVRVDDNASPADSLKGYNQVLEYRNQVLNGNFATIMQSSHNGKTVFGESLGYFNAFKMVYPFENVAYTTNVGEISMPFRTKFGFHILNVIDKRRSQGEVTVAHIMIANNNDKITSSPEERIKELHAKIIEGTSFSDLAKQFSDDKNSARNGGKLTRFGAGKLSAKEFENTAFALSTEGQVSKPVKTKFGWHIIKLLKKHDVPSFNELKSNLEQKVKKDSRSKIVNDRFYNNLKKRYSFTETVNAKEELLKVVNAEFIKGNLDIANDSYKKTLATFAGEKLNYLEYYKYLSSKLRSYKNLTVIKKIVTVSYNDFINARIYNYHNEHLESEYPEFKNIVQEYREGLLLFELMEQEIWKKSKTDTIGLKKYYNKNKTNYFWKKRIEAVVVTSETKRAAKNVRKLLKTNVSLKQLKELQKNSVVSEGLYELTDKELPKKYKAVVGVSKIFMHNNQYVVVKGIKEVLPKQQLLDEVKGRVINDFQTQIEKDWLVILASKYKVEVNQSVLESVKKSL
ncbi:MAG: peptidylprolyl isomerase [Flavobacteriaceae bacterium]|nr:peptidylprolyl isomerase [Flavobacteriaceae bacterium]